MQRQRHIITMNKRLFLYFLLIIALFSCSRHPKQADGNEEGVAYANMSSTDGILPEEFLPYNTIKSMRLPYSARQAMSVFQDKDGIMWVATSNGLIRYDGYSSESYLSKAANTKGIVMSMVQVDASHLLVGMRHGLALFNIRNGREDQLPEPLTKVSSVRYLLRIDDDIWIGTIDSGLLIYDLNKKVLTHCKAQERMTGIYSVCKIGSKLYVAALEGLFVGDLRASQLILKKDKRINTFVNSLLLDKKSGVLYIGTEGELYTIRLKTGAFGRVSALHGSVCKSMAFDKFGNILIGTDAGLCIYSPSTNRKKILSQKTSRGTLDSDIIWGVSVDKDDNLWLATQSGFSIISRPVGFTLFDLNNNKNETPPNKFSKLMFDHHRRLWLGGENGLTMIETKGGWGKTQNFSVNGVSPLRHNHVRCIYEDRDGYVWIATDGSIAKYNENSGRFEYVTLINHLGENGNWAYGLYEDRKGRMWIATYSGGLFIVDKKKLLSNLGGVLHENNQPQWMEKMRLDSSAQQLIPGTNGELWMLGINFVWRMDTQTDNYHRYYFAHSGRAAFYDNTLWTSSTEGEMIKFDRNSNRFVDAGFKIPMGETSILVMQGDKLWYSFPGGLMSFDVHRKKVSYYGWPKYLLLSGLYVPDDNKILWGGENFLAVSDTRLKPKKRQKVLITRVYNSDSINSTFMPSTKENIRLSRNHNSELSLSTLSYYAGQELSFYYLLGGEGKWQQLQTGTNILAFPHLASGTYKLELASTNPETDKDAVITTYTLKVPYPWYAQWWAYVIYVVILTVLIVLEIKRQRIKVQRRMIAEEREHVLESLKQRNEYYATLVERLSQKEHLSIESAQAAEKPVDGFDEGSMNENDAKFMHEVDSIIDEHIDDDSFGVSVLAEKMGLPQKQLYRKFKQITDSTLVAYIRMFRMKRAAELLRDGRYTVTEVMYMVGFSNVSYFTKCFSTEYGVTPKQYMEQ